MISIVSFSESRGGAAKATQKIVNAIRQLNIPVQYVVVEKNSHHSSALGPNRLQFAWHFLKRLTAFLLQKLQLTTNVSKHSLNLFSCNMVLEAIKNAKLVHLNWINNETISLAKLPSITSPLVITLHDEWFYCGSEHLALDSQRPFQGYSKLNKNVKGVDWDYLTWVKKIEALNVLKDKLIITAPSRWMVDRAKQSKLLGHYDVRHVPNIIDTQQFKKDDSPDFFKECILDGDVVILFGAVYGRNMELKGFSLLQQALSVLADRVSDKANILLVSFGGKCRAVREIMGFRYLELGQIAEARDLAQLYSRAHFTVVPSMVESFGQIAAESLACETPVLAFNYSGLKDIVLHQKNGYLAEPFLIESLADGLEWLLSLDADARLALGVSGRAHVIKNFSESVVVDKFLSIYRELGALT